MFLQINIKTNDLFVHILRIVNIYNYICIVIINGTITIKNKHHGNEQQFKIQFLHAKRLGWFKL